MPCCRARYTRQDASSRSSLKGRGTCRATSLLPQLLAVSAAQVQPLRRVLWADTAVLRSEETQLVPPPRICACLSGWIHSLISSGVPSGPWSATSTGHYQTLLRHNLFVQGIGNAVKGNYSKIMAFYTFTTIIIESYQLLNNTCMTLKPDIIKKPSQ
jgi:hypothetical protein